MEGDSQPFAVRNLLELTVAVRSQAAGCQRLKDTAQHWKFLFTVEPSEPVLQLCDRTLHRSKWATLCMWLQMLYVTCVTHTLGEGGGRKRERQRHGPWHLMPVIQNMQLVFQRQHSMGNKRTWPCFGHCKQASVLHLTSLARSCSLPTQSYVVVD